MDGLAQIIFFPVNSSLNIKWMNDINDHQFTKSLNYLTWGPWFRNVSCVSGPCKCSSDNTSGAVSGIGATACRKVRRKWIKRQKVSPALPIVSDLSLTGTFVSQLPVRCSFRSQWRQWWKFYIRRSPWGALTETSPAAICTQPLPPREDCKG